MEETTVTSTWPEIMTNYNYSDLIASQAFGETGLYNYPPLQNYYYQTYPLYSENSVSKSFSLVQQMIEKKIIKEPKTVEDFIKLVNEVSKMI
jgi:hypothetical protein